MSYVLSNKQKEYIDTFCRETFGCCESDFHCEDNPDGDTLASLPADFPIKLRLDSDMLYLVICELIESAKYALDGYEEDLPKNKVCTRPSLSLHPLLTPDVQKLRQQAAMLHKQFEPPVRLVQIDHLLSQKIPASVRNELSMAVGQYNHFAVQTNEEIDKKNTELANELKAVEKQLLDIDWIPFAKYYLFAPYPLPLAVLERIALDCCAFVQSVWSSLDAAQDVISEFDRLANLVCTLLELANE